MDSGFFALFTDLVLPNDHIFFHNSCTNIAASHFIDIVALVKAYNQLSSTQFLV